MCLNYIGSKQLTVGGFTITNYKIENVVASASLGIELDLQRLALSLDGSVYEPEQFPGLVYRIKNPKAALLLFKSGKIVCTGATSSSQIDSAVKEVIRQIGRTGVVITKDPEIVIQNVVASSDLGQAINLNAIAITLGLDKVEYEPEQFPGLVYRLDSPKTAILLFGSGKLVCTGAKNPQEVEAAVKRISEELRSAGQMQ